jgi:hypothetical protein
MALLKDVYAALERSVGHPDIMLLRSSNEVDHPATICGADAILGECGGEDAMTANIKHSFIGRKGENYCIAILEWEKIFFRGRKFDKEHIYAVIAFHIGRVYAGSMHFDTKDPEAKDKAVFDCLRNLGYEPVCDNCLRNNECSISFPELSNEMYVYVYSSLMIDPKSVIRGFPKNAGGLKRGIGRIAESMYLSKCIIDDTFNVSFELSGGMEISCSCNRYDAEKIFSSLYRMGLMTKETFDEMLMKLLI